MTKNIDAAGPLDRGVMRRPWIESRKRFELFAETIFGLDIRKLGGVYLKQATKDAWEKWEDEQRREDAIRELVEAAIGYNLDDVANNGGYFYSCMEAARAALSPADIKEAEDRFEAEWEKQARYCSGEPIRKRDKECSASPRGNHVQSRATGGHWCSYCSAELDPATGVATKPHN